MKCKACGSRMELSKYAREHDDGEGPYLEYRCSNEDTEPEDEVKLNHTVNISRSHKE